MTLRATFIMTRVTILEMGMTKTSGNSGNSGPTALNK